MRRCVMLASSLLAVSASNRIHYDHYVPGYYDLVSLLVILLLLVACLCAIDPAPPYHHHSPECTLVRIDPRSVVVVADERKGKA